MPDINPGALTEALNNKLDRDVQNIATPSLPITLVAVQYPTAANNYTWYRKYSDGWVEQGGAVVGLTDWANRTIELPVPMKDRGYSYTQSPIMYNAGGSGSWAVGITAKTETQVSSRFFSNNGYLPTWEVRGMAA